MHIFRHTALIALAAFGLSGCESTGSLFGQDGDGVQYVADGSGQIVAQPVVPAERQLTGRLMDGPSMPAPPTLTPLPGMIPMDGPVEYADMVDSDSVEIFSLDQPGPVGSRLPQATSPGVPASVDPDVEVFPFEGSHQGVFPDSRGLADIMPPAHSRQSYPSPFGGALAAPERAPVSVPSLIPPGGTSGEKVFFRHDSSELDASDRRLLTAVADEAKATGTPVVVEGHASRAAEARSPVERDIVNLRKSMDRAYSVSSTLIREGVPAEKIKTCAFGDNVPPLGTDGKSESDAARRVEVRTGN